MTVPAMTDPAFDLGYKFGSNVGVLIPIAFLVVAVRSVFQEDRNRKCSVGAVLTASAWSLTSIGWALSALTGEKGLLPPLCVLSLIAVLGAIPLAVLGLTEIARGGRRIRGRAQAVGSLTFAGIFLLVLLIGVLGVERGIPGDWKMDQPLPGSRISVVPKNFSVGHPGVGWSQVIAQKVNSHADVAFIHPKNKITVMVLAHAVPAANLTPIQAFAEGARKEMAQIDPGALVEPAQALTVGSCSGMSFNAEAQRRGDELLYREWVAIHGSVAYQVIGWGPKKDGDLVRQETERFIQSFEILAP